MQAVNLKILKNHSQEDFDYAYSISYTMDYVGLGVYESMRFSHICNVYLKYAI